MRQWLILAALAYAPNVRAQPADEKSSADAAALFDEGKRHFDIGEYAAAIVTWKQSYLISSEPLLLFNIGQAYRLSGNCAQANRFYLNYKRAVPKPTNVIELEQAMAKCVGVEPATGDDSKPADNSKPTDGSPAGTDVSKPVGPEVAGTKPAGADVAAGSSTTASSTSTPDTSDGRGLRIGGIVIASLGGAATAFAIVSAAKARDEANLVASQPGGTPWNPALEDHQSSGQSAQTRAEVFGAIGAAAIIGGGVLWWIGHGKARTRVDVAVTPGHAELGVSCAF